MNFDQLVSWQNSNPLRQWRKENKVSQHKFALVVGVTVASDQAWEGGSKRPNDENMANITLITGISKEAWDRWLEQKPSSTR